MDIDEFVENIRDIQNDTETEEDFSNRALRLLERENGGQAGTSQELDLSVIKNKIVNVLSELPGISKEDISFWSQKKGDYVSFPAFTSDMILNTIRPLLAEQGLGLFVDEGSIYQAYNHVLIEYIFTLWDNESGKSRVFKITNPISPDMKGSAAWQAADTFAIKRFWRRLLMIADPKENEELEHAIATDTAEEFEMETRVATIYSITKSDKTNNRRPTYFASGQDDGENDIQVSLWDNNMPMIAAMLGRNAEAITNNMPISFTEPLFLVVDSNKYGSWGISRSQEQIIGLRNPAIGYSFLKISGASKADALMALGVTHDISEFEGNIRDALGRWETYQVEKKE